MHSLWRKSENTDLISVLLKLHFPSFRTAVSAFTALVSARVSETVSGTFQTAELSSGPQKQCKSLKSEPDLLSLTDSGIIQYLLPLIKWNHAVLRYQWSPPWLWELCGAVTYSISNGATEYLQTGAYKLLQVSSQEYKYPRKMVCECCHSVQMCRSGNCHWCCSCSGQAKPV